MDHRHVTSERSRTLGRAGRTRTRASARLILRGPTCEIAVADPAGGRSGGSRRFCCPGERVGDDDLLRAFPGQLPAAGDDAAHDPGRRGGIEYGWRQQHDPRRSPALSVTASRTSRAQAASRSSAPATPTRRSPRSISMARRRCRTAASLSPTATPTGSLTTGPRAGSPRLPIRPSMPPGAMRLASRAATRAC